MHIGGFFELEKIVDHCVEMHPNALALHTGRACLIVTLTALSPRRVYVPSYTCDAALEPFKSQNIETVFYSINENFLPINLIDLKSNEYLLYVNYFGLCDKQVNALSNIYGSQLLIDDTHAFFRGQRDGFWSFTSARKYFGVPDGAYLYAPLSLSKCESEFQGISLKHLELRSLGHQAEGFVSYQQYELGFDCSVFGISSYSRRILSQIDYESVAKARLDNFYYLDQALAAYNKLSFDLVNSVPFCYPYFPKVPISHAQLYQRQIYPPQLWIDVLNRKSSSWEQSLTKYLLPLPIDHRYGRNEMQKIIYELGSINAN